MTAVDATTLAIQTSVAEVEKLRADKAELESIVAECLDHWHIAGEKIDARWVELVERFKKPRLHERFVLVLADVRKCSPSPSVMRAIETELDHIRREIREMADHGKATDMFLNDLLAKLGPLLPRNTPRTIDAIVRGVAALGGGTHYYGIMRVRVESSRGAQVLKPLEYTVGIASDFEHATVHDGNYALPFCTIPNARSPEEAARTLRDDMPWWKAFLGDAVPCAYFTSLLEQPQPSRR